MNDNYNDPPTFHNQNGPSWGLLGVLGFNLAFWIIVTLGAIKLYNVFY